MDKSLVLVAEQDGEARYRLLETVRQYGRVKLEEAGEGAGASRRHADLFLKQRVRPRTTGDTRCYWSNFFRFSSR